jgi:hypothetical protein
VRDPETVHDTIVQQREVRNVRLKIIMSEQTARRLSWSIAVWSFIVVMIGLGVSIHALVVSGQGVTFSHQFFTPLMTLTYGVFGALVASRHPRNPIGWMFCAIGLLSAFNMLSSGYALYSELALINDSLPGAMFARWLTIWIWIPNVLLPVTFPLLLFPDGKLLSTRWRPIVWAAGFGLFSVIIGMAFHPGPLEIMGMNGSNPYGISGGETVISALLTLAVPLLLVGVFGSIASIIVRFRCAVGIERAQLAGCCRHDRDCRQYPGRYSLVALGRQSCYPGIEHCHH